MKKKDNYTSYSSWITGGFQCSMFLCQSTIVLINVFPLQIGHAISSNMQCCPTYSAFHRKKRLAHLMTPNVCADLIFLQSILSKISTALYFKYSSLHQLSSVEGLKAGGTNETIDTKKIFSGMMVELCVCVCVCQVSYIQLKSNTSLHVSILVHWLH
jgi:hypothetical protein